MLIFLVMFFLRPCFIISILPTDIRPIIFQMNLLNYLLFFLTYSTSYDFPTASLNKSNSCAQYSFECLFSFSSRHTRNACNMGRNAIIDCFYNFPCCSVKKWMKVEAIDKNAFEITILPNNLALVCRI